MPDLFDPLDFLSSESAKAPGTSIYYQETSCDATAVETLNYNENWGPDEDVPIQPLDLPHVQYASPIVILTILKLLRPATQVNFKSEGRRKDDTWENISNEKGVTQDMLQLTLEYFKQWNCNIVQSKADICTKVPTLFQNKAFETDLSNYFTTILSMYEASTDELADQILQQASLRISERCGRTAQPSMTRMFELEGLDTAIKLHEPALTSDNLGLKTWGSSLVLAQKILNIPAGKRVLELGSGTGLVGIAYALTHSLNNEEVIFLTDLPEIVPNLQHNVQLNNLKNVIADVLDWTDPSSFVEKYGIELFDVIVIADPIYSPQHPIWVVDMISEFLSEDGKVYLQIPIRPKYEAERELLWNLLKENDLVVVAESLQKGNDDWGDVDYLYKEIVRSRKF